MFFRNFLTISACVIATLATLGLATGQGQPAKLTKVKLGGQLSDTFLEYVVNRADTRAGGKDTITMTYSVPQEGWISIGFTNGDGMMIGAEAVVGLPGSGEVLKYTLASYDNSGVLPMPEEQQTLIESAIFQEEGNTTMKFTKILNETGEVPIAIGANTFIGAFGFGNMFFYHEKRDSFDIDLVAGEIEIIETRNRTLWKIHGYFATLAWGLFSPMAIGVAVLRYWFPNGLWLKIHQYLNYIVVGLTILAFGFAVAAIKSETPAGGNPNHFSSSPSPHRFMGLILFLVVLFQTVGGQYRPHNPAKGEEKHWTRRMWEGLHRVFGLSLLATAWYQIESGIRIYQNLFEDSATTNLSAIFWGIVGTVCAIIVVGFIVTKIIEKDDRGDSANSEVEEVDDDQGGSSADTDI